MELAYKNAQMVLLQDTEKIKREEQRTVGPMQEIADWLSPVSYTHLDVYKRQAWYRAVTSKDQPTALVLTKMCIRDRKKTGACRIPICRVCIYC